MTQTSEKPIIGVLANDSESASAYADAIRRSEGETRLVIPNDSLSPQELLTGVDGLIVGGDERLPGEANDADDLRLLRSALEADLPVLCIGNGMQHLNVTLGGKAAPDASAHARVEGDGGEVSAYHRIYISPGSKLAAVVGSGGIVRVNSRHSLVVREGPQVASAHGVCLFGRGWGHRGPWRAPAIAGSSESSFTPSAAKNYRPTSSGCSGPWWVTPERKPHRSL